MSKDINKIQIQKVIENWVNAVQDLNMKGILANHPEDVVMFDVPKPLMVKGIEEYKKTWELFFKYSPGGKDSFELVDPKIIAGDKVAFCYSLLRIGGEIEPQCRLTLGLQKINDQWLIIHEHHSAPHNID